MILKLSRWRPLINEIDDLLSQDKSWSALAYCEINVLAGHAIQALGKDADVCLTESHDLDFILHLIAKQLLTGRYNDLNEVMASAVTAYLHDHLKQLYAEREDEREQEFKIEAGLRPWTNQQTGELEWSRA